MPDCKTDTTQETTSDAPLVAIKPGVLIKPIAFVLCLLPLIWLIGSGVEGNLGVNPVEATIRYLGDWALRFLLIALAVTPVRIMLGWSAISRLRRMLGLFAFFYIMLHVISYIGLDQFFYWTAIWDDITKRVYISLGMAASLMLVPLAVTSTNAMAIKLGGRKWRRLHQLVYPAAVLGVIHYFMMIKADYTEPLAYALILTFLFGVRLYKKWA